MSGAISAERLAPPHAFLAKDQSRSLLKGAASARFFTNRAKEAPMGKLVFMVHLVEIKIKKMELDFLVYLLKKGKR